jgi:hypothetical protein
MRLTLLCIGFLGAVVPQAGAQEGSKPAPVLQIFRESIKEGRSTAHEKLEAEYAALFRKVNFPGHYIALSAMSGSGEVWFVMPLQSFAASEELDKAMDKEPLKSSTGMMDSRDGELRSGSRIMWAVHRPDLSYGASRFNPAKTRYVVAGTFRVRLGKDEEFASGAKMYLGAHEKANIEECILAYQVVAGAPSGTYLFFTMMESMAAMDGGPERMQKVQQAMGEDNFARLMKGSGDLFASIEDTMFQVRPGMSYPPQSVVDADPAFWKPKPMAKPVSEATRAKNPGQ